LTFALGGCGTTVEDRGLSGAGLGAITGTVIGAVTGLGVWQGALVGAGVGAAAGALTDARDLDLGKPIWRQGQEQRQAGSAPAWSDASAHRPAPVVSHGSVVKDVQISLKNAGYDPGGTDGRMGAKTRAAIIRYQQDNGLPVDGVPSTQLLQHLKAGSI